MIPGGILNQILKIACMGHANRPYLLSWRGNVNKTTGLLDYAVKEPVDTGRVWLFSVVSHSQNVAEDFFNQSE
jgi:hypothetical protein